MNCYSGFAALPLRQYTPKEIRLLNKLAKEVMAFIDEQRSKNS